MREVLACLGLGSDIAGLSGKCHWVGNDIRPLLYAEVALGEHSIHDSTKHIFLAASK